MHMTVSRRAILEHMLTCPDEDWHAYRIGQDLGMKSGTVIPILRLFVQKGLLTQRHERINLARKEGRPPRVLYRVRPEMATQIDWLVKER
jgi:predicted transcriptional regulator